jgi:hypothetical protein
VVVRFIHKKINLERFGPHAQRLNYTYPSGTWCDSFGPAIGSNSL